MLQEFKDFVTKGNIVEVAVGLIMALYFQAIIDALLEGVLYPIIAAIFGKPDFRAIGFDLGDAFVSIGLVIDAVISFVIVALILFLVIKGYNKLKADADEADTGPSEIDLLAEIRDQLRANNG